MIAPRAAHPRPEWTLGPRDVGGRALFKISAKANTLTLSKKVSPQNLREGPEELSHYTHCVRTDSTVLAGGAGSEGGGAAAREPGRATSYRKRARVCGCKPGMPALLKDTGLERFSA